MSKPIYSEDDLRWHRKMDKVVAFLRIAMVVAFLFFLSHIYNQNALIQNLEKQISSDNVKINDLLQEVSVQ